MTFKQHQKHQHGTYASLLLSAASSKQLYDHISSLTDKVPKEEYHCTVCYSRNPVPEVENLKPDLPITAQALKYEVFPTKNGKHVLVLRIKSPELKALNQEVTDLGATSDYPEYKPHITLAMDSPNIDQLTLPTFPLVFDKFHVDGLDPEFETKIEK